MKLQNLIKKLNLNYINSNITDANFPDEGKRGKKFKLMNFTKPISSDDAITEMKKKGYRPATIHEMLEWVVKNRDGKELVIALGSLWRGWHGRRGVPCLWDDSDGRGLSLGCFECDWDESYRFLAVREVKTPLTDQ